MTEFKPRLTAYLVKIKELLDAAITEVPDQAATFYIHGREINVARVNLTGIVVSKNPGQGYNEFLLDDGSGAIPIRAFDAQIFDPEIGSMVRIIGRVREYNTARYVIPEIVKVLPDKNFLELHNLEIGSKGNKTKKSQTSDLRPQNPEKLEVGSKKSEEEVSPKQLVFELIKELDLGEGADIIAVAKKADIEDIDGVIDSLIKDGEIFKVAPSRVKVL